MRHALIIICLSICLGAGFVIDPDRMQYTRSWSFADPLIPLILPVMLLQFGFGQWSLDAPAVWQILGIGSIGLSALINGATGNGTMLNFGRTAITDFLLYVTMFNVARSVKDVRLFGNYCLLLAGVVLALGIPTLVTGWGGGFTNSLFVFGVTDLNTFGFLFVLLFCASSPAWLRDRNLTRGIICAAILAGGAITSLSRSAVTNLAVAVAITLLARDSSGGSRGRALKNTAIILGTAAGILIWFRLVGGLNGALTFGQNKIEGFGSDAINLRLIQLTLVPIQDWMSEPLQTTLFGDSVSYQHTFLANAVWMHGLLGLICGIGIYISLALAAMRPWRRRFRHLAQDKMTGSVFIALVLVMFFDDCATNHRFHAPILSYLFHSTAGAFAGIMRWQTSARPELAGMAQGAAGYPIRA